MFNQKHCDPWRLLQGQADGPEDLFAQSLTPLVGDNEVYDLVGLVNSLNEELTPVREQKAKPVDMDAVRKAFGIESSFEDYAAIGEALRSLVKANPLMLKRFRGFSARGFASFISSGLAAGIRSFAKFRGNLCSDLPISVTISEGKCELFSLFNESNIAFRLAMDGAASPVFVLAFHIKSHKPVCFVGRKLDSFERQRYENYEPDVISYNDLSEEDFIAYGTFVVNGR